MQGPYVENCQYVTPKSVYDSSRMFMLNKMGIHIETHMESEDYIIVSVGDKEPQRIDAENVFEMTSVKQCFLCPCCGEKAFKLYLVPNGKDFKCRKCHKLKYELSGINKKSRHGKMLYSMNRMNKLIKMRESLSVILRNGEYTKKFKSFLKQCEHAGYMEIVNDAIGLLKALKEFESAQNLDRA